MALELAELRRNPTDGEMPAGGTGFGSPAPMLSQVPRQRDRRLAWSELLAAVTRALDRRLDVSLMRCLFEAAVRRTRPLRSVRLREGGSRWGGVADGAAESVALEVPAGDPEMPGVLEAAFDPGCCLGDWDFQLLGLAAQIGGLVLE